MNFCLEKVVDAYYSCRNNKRNTYSSLLFEYELFSNINSLYEDIYTYKYKPSPSICFVVTQPKIREVWAALFRDRVVHHLIYNELNPYWSKRWSADSCATIEGRGTLYGVKRLHKHIRSITNNWSEDAFYLKCDLSNFFNSIDKDTLWRLLLPSIKEDWVEFLTYEVLYNDPTKNGIYLSSEELYNKIPKRKRLKFSLKGRGIPIGNLTSQMFANVLLNELDQFVKRDLKVKKYVRYVDDFIILDSSKEFLKAARDAIVEFLCSLNLKINPKKTFIHHVSRGVSFVGHTIYPFRWIPLKSTVERSLKRVKEFPESVDSYVALFNQSEKSYNLINNMLSTYNLETRVNWEKY